MSALADPEEQTHRRERLAARHMAPLAPLLAGLRRRFGEVPDPDPVDGGAFARLLLLLETPGPRIRATGIVSLDNPAGTSRNLAAFLADAGISRAGVMIWNAVPWIIHDRGAPNRAPRKAEIEAGVACLPHLLHVMPNLVATILCGRVAARAAPILSEARPGLHVLRMPHPSPTIQCTSPLVRARSREACAAAAALLAPQRSAA